MKDLAVRTNWELWDHYERVEFTLAADCGGCNIWVPDRNSPLAANGIKNGTLLELAEKGSEIIAWEREACGKELDAMSGGWAGGSNIRLDMSAASDTGRDVNIVIYPCGAGRCWFDPKDCPWTKRASGRQPGERTRIR